MSASKGNVRKRGSRYQVHCLIGSATGADPLPHLPVTRLRCSRVAWLVADTGPPPTLE